VALGSALFLYGTSSAYLGRSPPSVTAAEPLEVHEKRWVRCVGHGMLCKFQIDSYNYTLTEKLSKQLKR